ncbi:MAG: type II toxin-antitoxin system VapC family toxin [Chloroflexi bacterium]|nr:type II toxin-antitoxin system VapC family toxin [Chloroflexota bacterium]
MTDRIVIDTSALYAAVAPSDAYHSQAESLYKILLDAGSELYLTSYVLLETSAIVHRRLGFPALRRLTEDLEPLVRTYWIQQATHDEAWKALLQRDGVGPSLVDWTTILVARDLGALVFTFDRHFEAEGLSVLPRRIGS